MEKIIITLISCLLLFFVCPEIISAAGDLSVDNIAETLNPELSRGMGGKRPGTAGQEFSITFYLKFGKDSQKLAPGDITLLQNLGAALQRESLKGYVYKIEGHTSDLGDDEHNLKLSRRRALAVRDFLKDNFNMPAEQFEIQGFGGTQPAVPNTDEHAGRKNRRIVIRNTRRIFHPQSTEGDPQVSVRIKRLRNYQESLLQDGDVMTQQDSYAIEFQSETRAYIYIYQTDSVGQMFQIFPNTDFSAKRNPLKAGQFYRLPESNNWFFLDENVGKEEIIVLAHKSPLDEPNQVCKQVLAEMSEKELGRGLTRGLTRAFTRAVNKRRDKPGSELPREKETSRIFIWKQHFIHR